MVVLGGSQNKQLPCRHILFPTRIKFPSVCFCSNITLVENNIKLRFVENSLNHFKSYLPTQILWNIKGFEESLRENKEFQGFLRGFKVF